MLQFAYLRMVNGMFSQVLFAGWEITKQTTCHFAYSR